MIKKHGMIAFYTITFLLSGILLLLHVVMPSAGNYSVSFPQFAPALAVLFLTFITSNCETITDIKARLTYRKGQLKWFCLTTGLSFLLIITSCGILSLLKYQYAPWSGNVLFYILNIAFMLLGCFGEEIGWRGFLLPALQKRYSPFASAVIIGAFWGAWHLNFTNGILGFILYTVTIIEVSLLYTWLYNKSGGSLLLMVLAHFLFNLFSHFLLWQRFGISLYLVQIVLFGAACLAVIVKDKNSFFRKPEYKVQPI